MQILYPILPPYIRACYFVCSGEKSKSVFCVCVCNKLVKQCKTHILYRCFTQIQLLSSVIQRVDCIRFATFVYLAHLWEWGHGCCYRGGQGVNKKQRKPFKTWINSKNMLHDFQQKNIKFSNVCAFRQDLISISDHKLHMHDLRLANWFPELLLTQTHKKMKS
jgi:hypothetical protein